MTEPLDIDAIRARHTRRDSTIFEPYCDDCEDTWPCDAVRLCDEVERVRRMLAQAVDANDKLAFRLEQGPRKVRTPDEEWEIARAKWQQDLYKHAGQMMARAASSRGLLDAIDNESGQSEAPSVSEGGCAACQHSAGEHDSYNRCLTCGCQRYVSRLSR